MVKINNKYFNIDHNQWFANVNIEYLTYDADFRRYHTFNVDALKIFYIAYFNQKPDYCSRG
jgi:hypothetical protein